MRLCLHWKYWIISLPAKLQFHVFQVCAYAFDYYVKSHNY